MDHILAKVKGKGKKKYFKLISDNGLYDVLALDLSTCVPYDPDHNLDEDSWFKIEHFSQQPFCIDLLKRDFDSKDYDDLKKANSSRLLIYSRFRVKIFIFRK